MKNFPVIVDGKEHWISRSMCVAIFIYRRTSSGREILAVKRGKGCPNEIGKWCCPCGYLDYDETLKEAALREVREETGVSLNPSLLKFVGYNDKPTGKQNVTFRYKYNATFETRDHLVLSTKYAEPNEVDDIKWIPINDLSNYEFAFGHKDLILKYIIL